MNPTTRSPIASFRLTARFADDASVVLETDPVEATTHPRDIIEIELDAYSSGVRAGDMAIDEFVNQAERDPARAAALAEARQWVAETFYSGEESLRAMRLRKGLSQARLAVLVGTTQPHIARIESGTPDVQINTLTRIAQALKEDPVDTIRAFLNSRQAVIASDE